MLGAILQWSLQNRGVVLVLWALVAVLGVFAARALPLDAFPDTTPVQVQINTVAPALGPLEIERQITMPVEWSVSGMSGLQEVRSLSRFGFSQVTATFEEGTNVYLARQLVRERLDGVELAPGLERPRLGPVATGLGEVFHYLVQGPGASLSRLREVQETIIAPQLRSVSGVAEVNTWGGDERQVQVLVDPVRLRQFGLSLQEFAEALEANNTNVGAGVLEQGGQASLVQGVGLVRSAEEVGRMVVATPEGVPLRVDDVARVVEGREIRRGAVTADGKGEAVLGLGFMLPGENSREVTERLALRLSEVQKSLPEGIRAEPAYERTELVDRVLETVRRNLFEAALLVVAILFAFLGSLRAGLLVALAIPLSMLFATSLMLKAGIAGSLMSLGALDFGLLVDSSVIQVENVLRRGTEEQERRPWLDIVRDAVLEVRKPTLLGELVIAVVYLPVLTLEGIEGKLFRPMALTVLFALAGSMLLSLTLMPVLASYVLRPWGRPHRAGRWLAWLTRGYRRGLEWSLAHRTLVAGVAVALVANAILLGARLGTDFVPRLWEGAIVINKVQLAGVSLEESARVGLQVEKRLLEKFPDTVARVWTRTGTAEVATDPMGIELADIFVMLHPRERWKHPESQEALAARIARELEGFPGVRLIYTQPIEMRVNEMLAGIRADVGVRLFGDDLEELKARARDIEAVLKAIPGATDVFTEQITGQPVVEVQVDREAAARHGLTVAQVLGVVEALGGRTVGNVQYGERRVPLVLRLEEGYGRDATSLGSVLVRSPQGAEVPLSRVARLVSVEGPATIQREWGKRRIVIQANVRGRDLGSFVQEARAALAREVALPPGYFVRLGGQFEHLARAQARLWVVVPLSLGLVFVLLLWSYGGWLDAVRVFTGVPFAAVGGIAALWLRDMPLTVSAAVGFVVLSGVCVLGDMVMVSSIRQNLARGEAMREAVLAAATTRLRPVLMTSLVAALGFVPMALSEGFGAEVQRPLATVVIGGLVSSTLLTLFVLPVLYVGWRRPAAEERGTV